MKDRNEWVSSNKKGNLFATAITSRLETAGQPVGHTEQQIATF